MATLSCPTCRRLTARGGRGGRGCLTWLFVVLLFPIGLLLLLLRPTYRCTSCGYRFKA